MNDGLVFEIDTSDRMACGENAGYTSPTPDQWSAIKTYMEQGMLSERPPDDGHRRNLLSTSYHRIVIGISPTNACQAI